MTSFYRRSACGHVCWGKSASQSTASSASAVLIGRKTYGEYLGPFYGAIAVPSVTRCRCCRRRRCRGYRCAGGVRQWPRATVATPGEWQCKTGGVRRLAVANGPNIFQMLLHANSPDVASGTVTRRLRIDVHDANDNDDNDNT